MAGSFLTSDLPALFASSEFGEAIGSVTYKGTVVSGIFDDEDIEVALGEAPVTIQHQAMFTGMSADFEGIADGDAMVIRGVNYTVRFWMDDGTGTIEIFLEKAT